MKRLIPILIAMACVGGLALAFSIDGKPFPPAADTSGFVDETITNDLATVAYVDGATNQGWVTESITNSLATVAYVDAATNAGAQDLESVLTQGRNAAAGSVTNILTLEGNGSGNVTNFVNGHFTGAVTVGGRLTVADLMAEQSQRDGAAQAFTGAGGDEIVTNWMANVTDASFTRTHSNITVTPAGRYTISMDASYTTDSGSDLHAHLFTNGLQAVDSAGNSIGWHRVIANANDDGSVAGSRTITLEAGAIVDWRIDAGANENLIWDHATFRIERK